MILKAVSSGLLLSAVLVPPFLAGDDPIPNPNIDMPGHIKAVQEALELRQTRRLSEADFLQMMFEPGTVLLDARSRAKFSELHLKGAVNLPFTDFSVESLALVLGSKDTRVLIYCNNNFQNAPDAFFSKMGPAALNLSTFENLYIYGYKNVYELGPLLYIRKTVLPLEGSLAPKYR